MRVGRAARMGAIHERLIQRHSTEDHIEFARSLEVLFRDPRYIRITGQPVVMIYRPAILPDAGATKPDWPTPYIVMAQLYGDDDPRIYVIDALAGFPPHRVGFRGEPVSGSSLQLSDSKYLSEVYERSIESKKHK
jgi:hypothetical protein